MELSVYFKESGYKTCVINFPVHDPGRICRPDRPIDPLLGHVLTGLTFYHRARHAVLKSSLCGSILPSLLSYNTLVYFPFILLMSYIPFFNINTCIYTWEPSRVFAHTHSQSHSFPARADVFPTCSRWYHYCQKVDYCKIYDGQLLGYSGEASHRYRWSL
jgi:hypothetical protein